MKKLQPSRTAVKVAANILTLGTNPEMKEVLPKGIVEATKKLLVESGVLSPTAVKWSLSPKMSYIYSLFDWLLPGQHKAFGYRKAFFEKQVMDALDNGALQVLILGSGFDTLAWRLAPRYPQVNFIEIDEDSTMHFKKIGIEKMAVFKNHLLISADLSQRKIEDVLENDANWDPLLNSIICAEGLVMYLDSNAVLNLFSKCSRLTGPQSRFAFSFIPADENGKIDAGSWTSLMLWLQRKTGEPWLWSLKPKELPDFGDQTGWNFSPNLCNEIEKQGVELFVTAHK